MKKKLASANESMWRFGSSRRFTYTFSNTLSSNAIVSMLLDEYQISLLCFHIIQSVHGNLNREIKQMTSYHPPAKNDVTTAPVASDFSE